MVTLPLSDLCLAGLGQDFSIFFKRRIIWQDAWDEMALIAGVWADPTLAPNHSLSTWREAGAGAWQLAPDCWLQPGLCSRRLDQLFQIEVVRVAGDPILHHRDFQIERFF